MNGNSKSRVSEVIDQITNFLGSPISIILHFLILFAWLVIGLDYRSIVTIFGLEGTFIWLFAIHSTNKIRELEWRRDRWERKRDREKLEADVYITQKDLKITQEVYKNVQDLIKDVEEIKARLIHEESQRSS